MSDFSFVRGDTVERSIALYSNGVVQGTGSIASAKLVAIGNRLGGRVEVDLVVQAEDLLLAIPAAESETIAADTYRFSIRVEFSDGTVKTWRSADKSFGQFSVVDAPSSPAPST